VDDEGRNRLKRPDDLALEIELLSFQLENRIDPCSVPTCRPRARRAHRMLRRGRRRLFVARLIVACRACWARPLASPRSPLLILAIALDEIPRAQGRSLVGAA
jgi:hypothetical protein